MKTAIVRHSGRFVFVWATVILVLCAMPGRFIPAAGWMDLLSLDKLVHAGVFFVLAALITVNVAVNSRSGGVYLASMAIAVIYGFVLEIMQATIFIDRSFEWTDAVANSFGVVVVGFIRARLIRWIFG